MSFVPDYKIYASDNATLVYTINNVINDNSPQDSEQFIEHTNLRAKGSVIVEGGQAPWNLELQFVLRGTSYEDLIAKMDSIQSTIALNTSYYIKIGRTSTTTQDYKVKRLQPIQWENSKRTRFIYGTLILRVNSW